MVSTPRPASAQESNVRRLTWNPPVDIAVTATASILLVTSEVLKLHLVPDKCRWCYRRADGADALNPVDSELRQRLRWDHTRTADTISSVIAFGTLPAGTIGASVFAASHDDALRYAPIDLLITAEATTIAALLNQAVKFAFARERPFVHYLPRAPDGVRALTDSPSDDNLSFYSGHTNLAFALATSSGTVALMRGYRLAPLVLGVGLASATAVGYLRIAADKHYFSDVMVGAVVGSVVGSILPLVFHHPSSGASPPPIEARQALDVAASPMRAPFVVDGTW